MDTFRNTLGRNTFARHTFGSNIESAEWLEAVEAGEEDTIEGKKIDELEYLMKCSWEPRRDQAVQGIRSVRLSPRELRELERLERLEELKARDSQ